MNNKYEHKAPNTRADKDIQRFLDKHDLSLEQQFKCLVEEIGEVSEAILTEQENQDVARELGDVMFIARTMIQLLNQQPSQTLTLRSQQILEDTAARNLEKNTSTTGNKITKEQ